MASERVALRLLFVDDEPDIRDSLKLLLEWSIPGLQVGLAASGREGLALLREQSFQLVVSDFKMPEMDGLEFLTAVQKEWPSIPRIMFTAFADDALATKVRETGVAQDFLSKTADPMAIVRAIESRLTR